MTKDKRTLLLVDFYRSFQYLEDAYAAFERGDLLVADSQVMNAIAVAERVRVALITAAAAGYCEREVSRGTSPPRRRIGGES